jgi:hypothetical protein
MPISLVNPSKCHAKSSWTDPLVTVGPKEVRTENGIKFIARWQSYVADSNTYEPARRKSLAATPTAFQQRSRRLSTLNLQGPPSSLHVAGGWRWLRAHCEVCAHIAPREPAAAAPAALHPLRSRTALLGMAHAQVHGAQQTLPPGLLMQAASAFHK